MFKNGWITGIWKLNDGKQTEFPVIKEFFHKHIPLKNG